jgi:hypothetical protein
MQDSKEQNMPQAVNSKEKNPIIASGTLGLLTSIGLIMFFFALAPFFGRSSGALNVLTASPLIILLGGVISVAHYSIRIASWHLFFHSNLRSLSIIGTPLIMIGIAANSMLLWFTGCLYLIAALFGLIQPSGLMSGLRRSWPILLIALSLGIVGSLAWLRFTTQKATPWRDAHNCLIGREAWCEENKNCIDPWVSPCGKSDIVDAFNELKKLRNFSKLEMSDPITDDFSWMAERGSEVANYTIPGLITRFHTSNINLLDEAFLRADFEPDMVNSFRVGNGGARGYRLFQLLVCAVSFVEDVTNKIGELSGVISCGRWDQAKLAE